MSTGMKAFYDFPWLQQPSNPTYGFRSNAFQFLLAAVITFFVGGLISVHKFMQARMSSREFGETSYTSAVSYLYAFGVSKAIFNFVVGSMADKFGRKWTQVAGWLVGVLIPILTLAADNWATIVSANVFLGIQQALCWSTLIFIMIDLLGPQHKGLAVGINETIGYTAIAIFSRVASDLEEAEVTCAFEDSGDACEWKKDLIGECVCTGYRPVPYYLVIAFVAAAFLGSLLLLRDTLAHRELEAAAKKEEKKDGQDVKASEVTFADDNLRPVRVFLYYSFQNRSTFVCCVAGLAINFLTGLAWGLVTIWAGDDLGYSGPAVGVINSGYSFSKGLTHFAFGFLSDILPRRLLISSGFVVNTAALLLFLGAGEIETAGEEVVFGELVIASVMLGIGTGMMYAPVIAAMGDHSSVEHRATAIGTYRFWRDMGYAVGALITAGVADVASVGAALGVSAFFSLATAVAFWVMYEDIPNKAITDEENIGDVEYDEEEDEEEEGEEGSDVVSSS